MRMEFDILPECYVDTNVIATMLALEVPSAGMPNHCMGCNKVCGSMSSGKLSDSFALGIIDNDKMEHSYVQEFCIVGAKEHIQLLKHKCRHHFIIRINPAMDRFILDVAERQGVRMSDYELPVRLKDFTKLTKDANAKDDANMKRLFKKLKGDGEMKTLRRVLAYLYNNKYSYDLDVLKNIVNQ